MLLACRGPKVTTYCTFTGKQVAGEVDGPEDFWVVVLITAVPTPWGPNFEPILQCIRCGACMNVPGFITSVARLRFHLPRPG